MKTNDIQEILDKLTKLQEKMHAFKSVSNKNIIKTDEKILKEKKNIDIKETLKDKIHMEIKDNIEEIISKKKDNTSTEKTTTDKEIIGNKSEKTILNNSIITNSSYIDIESDGYTIIQDCIQLYNGNYLKCPSLSIAGTFLKNQEKNNQWDFVDAEFKIRGRLRRVSNMLDMNMEGGKWTHFTCTGLIRLIGSIENENIFWNKNIVAAKGKNEEGKDSELVIKSYTPFQWTNIDNESIFLISFMSRQSHVLTIF